MGYLTDTEPLNMLEALRRVLAGDYTIENRMTLNGGVSALHNTSICGMGKPIPYNDSNALSLNEFCIAKADHNHSLITYDVLRNEEFINTYRADGLIVSTPTGSTAYNLSAGGPVLPPDADIIALTPICPQGLIARPSVLPGRDIISVRLKSEACLLADGREFARLSPGDTVTIRASDTPMRIIKTSNLSFFDVLRQKMVI